MINNYFFLSLPIKDDNFVPTAETPKSPERRALHLATYPSPKLTLTITSHFGQNDGLGEG